MPGVSGAQGEQDPPGRRVIFLLMTLACLGAALPLALPPAVPALPVLAANTGKFCPLMVRINLHVKLLI